LKITVSKIVRFSRAQFEIYTPDNYREPCIRLYSRKEEAAAVAEREAQRAEESRMIRARLANQRAALRRFMLGNVVDVRLSRNSLILVREGKEDLVISTESADHSAMDLFDECGGYDRCRPELYVNGAWLGGIDKF